MRAKLLEWIGPAENYRNQKMIVEYTRYKIGENRRQAFIDAHRQAIRHLHFRCIRYELTRCSDQREWYTLRIEWESTEQLRRFRDDASGKAFLRAVNGFERDIQEKRHWVLTDVIHAPMALELGIAEGVGVLADRPPWNRLYPWILERLQQRILVDEMAERVNMSPRNFARVFHREFRIPPGEFLDRVRVAAAKIDLEEGVLSIEQVAIARGFGSTSTMRRTFFRVLGVVPSEYREKISFHCNRTGDSAAELKALHTGETCRAKASHAPSSPLSWVI